jgi:hypothetical protein
VAERIHKAALGAPQEIFCVLSSAWHVSETRMIDFKKNTPFVFTAKLAEDLVQKEIKLFEEKNMSKSAGVEAGERIIELKNIKTALNGYETLEPLEQKAKELEMIIFISMSEEKVLKKIESVIAKYFHSAKIKFSSFALSSFTVVRDMHAREGNFLLLDIGGEITNISMVKKNIHRQSISFPLGYNFMIREVSSGLGTTLHEADSLISLFRDGHAEESVAEKLGGVIDKLKIKWLKEFQESLANLSNDISIPSVIYMTIDKDFADFFMETIKSEQFNQYTLTESKFEVVFLDAQMFYGNVAFKEPVVREPSLIIDSIYIDRLINPKKI